MKLIKKLRIAIDGESGSGKSYGSKIIAKKFKDKLNLLYLLILHQGNLIVFHLNPSIVKNFKLFTVSHGHKK